MNQKDLTSHSGHQHEIPESDRVGVLLSAFCGVHCLLLPFASSAIPLIFNAHSVVFHLVMLVLIVPVAVYAFYKGYRRHHQWSYSVLAVAGIALLSADLWGHAFHEWMWTLGGVSLLPIFGSLCLITAHWLNWKCKECSH